MHVVEQMAMKRPVTECVSRKIERDFTARRDDDCVLSGRKITMACDQLEKVTVQVDRVRHHRIIDQVYPDALAFEEGDWRMMVGHLYAVE